MLVSGELDGHKYAVVTQAFRDAVQIFVYKDSRISKVFRCQLQPHPGGPPPEIDGDLVLPGISPEPLVGTSLEDSSGNLYASLIASMVSRQNPDDTRSIIIGLGSVGPRSTDDISSGHRHELLLVTKLVEQARVW